MKEILVVEDEYAIAELVSIILEEAGYRVTIAQNGREGLNYLAAHRPALVICDVMMPLLDGRQLARVMHTNPAYRAIPIVMMSALPELAQHNGLYAAYLNKPFDPDDLLEVIARFAGPPES